jgi:hypothetical protein
MTDGLFRNTLVDRGMGKGVGDQSFAPQKEWAPKVVIPRESVSKNVGVGLSKFSNILPV